MKSLAFYFTGSDKEHVEAMIDVIDCVSEYSTRRFNWVFILSPFLYLKAKRTPNCLYIKDKRSAHVRYPAAVRVGEMFSQWKKSSWVSSMTDWVIKHFEIKATSRSLLNSMATSSEMRRDPTSKVSMVFESIFNPCDGYGGSAANLAVNMAKHDPKFCWRHLSEKTDARRHATQNMISLARHSSKQDAGSAEGFLQYCTPNGYHGSRMYRLARKRGIPTGIFTMWETTRLPVKWTGYINNAYDYCVVPAEFNKRIFQDSGVKVPVYVSPLGLDLLRWPEIRRRPPQGRPYRFLMFCNAPWDDPRKNAQLILNSFRQAFGGRKDVELVIKHAFGGGSPALRRNERSINARLTHAELVSLMESCDCLVFPSNGEGYGLPPREAMAMGMPVILSNWSALEDLCKDGISYWVDPVELQPAVRKGGWIESENNGSAVFGKFAKISQNDLAQKMLYVFRNQEEACMVGEAASKHVRATESYSEAARSLLSVEAEARGSSFTLQPTNNNTPKDKIMELTVDKVTKRAKKRYVYFTVKNTSGAELKASKSLFVRFWKATFADGEQVSDPEWSRLELKDTFEAGEEFSGRLIVDLKETGGAFTGDLGVVNTGVRWFDTVSVTVE